MFKLLLCVAINYLVFWPVEISPSMRLGKKRVQLSRNIWGLWLCRVQLIAASYAGMAECQTWPFLIRKFTNLYTRCKNPFR
jgi:hypothetical protein